MRKNVLILLVGIALSPFLVYLILMILASSGGGNLSDLNGKNDKSEFQKPQFPPYFSTPMENYKVSSPLTIKGSVPAGWMFEGTVLVKLLDENRKVIAKVGAGEVHPGTWMDEEPDEFKATLTFTTTAKSGYLVVEADNPSGLPENDKSYEIPIRF